MIAFLPVLQDFADSLDALREFVTSLGPVLQQQEKDLWITAYPVLGRFAAAAILTGEVTSSGFSDEGKAKMAQARELILKMSAPEFDKSSAAREIVKKTLPIKFVDGKAEIDWNVAAAAEIVPAKRKIDAVKEQLRLLHESSLMALTSRSEWFIAQLLHLYFRAYPGAAGMSDPFFSLAELTSLQSIDDAKDVLIEHKVETLMRESLEDWLKFFKEKPKLGMGYLSNEIGRMSEVFKRRNLVVHNGGRAGRRYFKEVDESLRPGVQLGEVVDVSAAYLNAAIDLLEHQLLLLGAELWKHLEPKDEQRGRFLMTASVRNIDRGCWNTARGLSRFGMNDKDLPESLRLSNQINYWQSFKWAGQYEEIRTEVEKTDFSAKAPLYQLALAAISDDFESCFKLLPGLLERKEIKRVELNSWPLFRNVRQRPEFSDYRLTDETPVESMETKPDDDDARGVVN